ncbi:MAG: hypothetical protein KDD94_03160 [Calditrichaeota bacterium]|nr:hypothetical protein [Calditrichota bacterium]
MKKVLTLILLFLLISCGDSFSNDNNSKKDLKKIQVSRDGDGGSGPGDGGSNPPPGGGG